MIGFAFGSVARVYANDVMSRTKRAIATMLQDLKHGLPCFRS